MATKTKYENNKEWRLRHPDKRQEQKKRYYRKTVNARNDKQPWSPNEVRMVMEHSIPDMELAEKIGRSVLAIQKKRWMMKNRREV